LKYAVQRDALRSGRLEKDILDSIATDFFSKFNPKSHMSTTSIVVLLVVAILWIFIWRRSGLRNGRAYGNCVAEHLGLSNNLFHSLLDNGVDGPSLMLLAALEKAGLSAQQASIELGPSLDRGARQLEARFGPQRMIQDAKPIITSLVEQWEARQQDEAPQH
jgi:hypothetical protein